MSLTADRSNECNVQNNLSAVQIAKYQADAFVQRNLSSFLLSPKIVHNKDNGIVTVELYIDCNTLKDTGLLFLSHSHPEYKCPKVNKSVVQDAGRTTPGYHYFGHQLQYEINTALTPTAENSDTLIIPVKIDIKDKYASILPPALSKQPNLVLYFVLEFGLIRQLS